MASRLRRMLLLNTRTSGTLPSGAINEVDPRGGAAVTGENSVGKTTTMELIPLFFGTLPSQIAEAIGGREPMLRFVLPTAQSAIVFEYQRGDDEEQDVRCAILRRSPDGDSAEYRLIMGHFREDLFTMVTPAGVKVFRDDAQMVEAITASGMRPMRKLSIADYRSVILGLKAMNQDGKELRHMSMQFGFANRSLPHLDRLISAVVKEKVNFKDFVHVAVTIVQEAIGGPTTGLERSKFSLRQSRSQIDRWLANRDACEAAFNLAPKVEKLREAIRECNLAELQLREEKLQIAPLQTARRDALRVREKSRQSLESDREDAIETEIKKLSALQITAANAKQAHDQSDLAVKMEEERRKTLHLSVVETWASQLEGVKGLKDQVFQIGQQLEIAKGKSSAIAHGYEQQIQHVNVQAATEEARLLSLANEPRDRFDKEREGIQERARQRLAELDSNQETEREEISQKLQAISGDIERSKALAELAGASPDLLQNVVDTELQLSSHRQMVNEALERAHLTSILAIQAQAEFQAAERQQIAALHKKQGAEGELAVAQDLLTPADGTLISALRADASREWKGALSRALDPALLQRKDLSPVRLDEDSAGALYGWSLSTENISQPYWTDDEGLRERIAIAVEALRMATEAVSESDETLEKTSKATRIAQKERSAAESAHSLLTRKTAEREAALMLATQRRDADIATARKEAQAAVKAMEVEQDKTNAKYRSMRTRHQAAREEVSHGAAGQVKLAGERRDQSLQSLARQREAAMEAAAKRVSDLTLQRDRHLQNEGVDVKKLKALEVDQARLNEEIERIEGRKSIVNLWRRWLEEGGHDLIEDFTATAGATKQAWARAKADLDRLNEDIAAARQRYESAIGEIKRGIEALEDDIVILGEMEARFGLSGAPLRLVDVTLSATDLRRHIGFLEEKMFGAEETVKSQFRGIREELTGRPGSVKELVEQSLQAVTSHSSIGQAEELCIVHRSLERQVLPNIINDAQIILEQIRQFRRRINTFETEVGRFNRELQKGLDGVVEFKRLKAFKVNVVTDFSTVGFMKGLDLIDQVAREGAARAAASNTLVLPDAKTAAALREFGSLLGQDSALEIDLARHITLKGSVTVNDVIKHFTREEDLEHISSTGLNAIILITLLSGMLNMIRGDEKVYIPWVTDEVGKFDPANFNALMHTLRVNHIDVVTASPKLTIAEYRHFERCYIFKDRGCIARFAIPTRRSPTAAEQPALEV